MMDRRFKGPPEARFATKWMPEPNSGCWLWLASVSDKGYGHFAMARGDCWQAHRASWALHRGPIPDGMQVLHKCDVMGCVNPDHLYVGTHLDNMRDKRERGKNVSLKGENNGRARLTAGDVETIRACGGTVVSVATHYGVTPATVSHIRLGRLWRHLLPPGQARRVEL